MDLYPGWAKRMAELQISAYNTEHGLENFSIVRPSNIYGPGDNFDEKNAMVIPSLMARVFKGERPVNVWGDGSAERDFLFSKDAARGIILALFRGTNSKPVNLGCGYGISIKELVETLQQVVDFEAFFDVSKPSGFKRRIMDGTYARELIGFEPKVDLFEGLRQTWEWFCENQDEYKKKVNYFK